MEQHVVARLQALHRQRFLQQVLRRQALEHHGRAGLEVDRVGQPAHGLRRHHAHLAIAARRHAGVGHTVAHGQVRHAGAHGLDHARALHADAGRHLQRVQAGAVVDVDEVQPDGAVAYAHLPGAGLAHVHLGQFQYFGAAVLADLNG